MTFCIMALSVGDNYIFHVKKYTQIRIMAPLWGKPCVGNLYIYVYTIYCNRFTSINRQDYCGAYSILNWKKNHGYATIYMYYMVMFSHTH